MKRAFDEVSRKLCMLLLLGPFGVASLAPAQTAGQLIPHKMKLESV